MKLCAQFNAWMPRLLLVSTLVGLTADQACGADAWDVLGPARMGAAFDELSQQVALTCSGDAERRACAAGFQMPIVFAGVPVNRIEAGFDGARLVKVTVVLGEQQYQGLLYALTTRYGEGEDRSFVARAGMAGEFLAGVYLWRKGGVSLVLEQYAGKIDRSALSYGSEQAMAELIRKTTAYPRGAHRDL